MDGQNSPRLLSIVERVERLEVEKAEISAAIRDVLKEAKDVGFDPKALKAILRLRKMNAAQREEHEALVDLYKGSLGMLGDTPLGEAAVRRLSKKPDEDGADDAPAMPFGELTDAVILDARELGAKWAREGKAVTENPYPAHDPRRAAFDEGWCQAAGSDGMDIPEAWRRTKPAKKPKKTDGEDAGENGEPPAPASNEPAAPADEGAPA